MNQSTDWQQLDSKVLLIGPVGVFRQILLPSVIALVGVGSQQPRWLLLAAPALIIGSIVVGAIPWFTTRFRIADGQLVVTTGLVNRNRLTAPLDRIRSVDLEATLLHRILGLQKVQVGTGVDDTQIVLDALSMEQARRLRTDLLSRRTSPPAADAWPGVDIPSLVVPRQHDLVSFSPGWARFAPFSLGRLAVALGALGAVLQFAGDIRVDLTRGNDLWDRVASTSLLLVVLAAVGGALALWTLLSMVAYLVQWWEMRLFREDGNLRLTRGLFTTQSTTIEELRIRGVRVRETALLRSVDGGELHALVTGLEDSVYAVLPQAPTPVAVRVASDILGDDEPIAVALAAHGPSALRRAVVRNLLALLPLLVGVVVLVLLLEGSWWLPVFAAVALAPLGILLGRMEYSHLGHALTTEHLVAGSGITSRTRTVLQRSGVIGWVVSQNFFQRRQGLATLVATTAAGSEKVVVRDIPLAVAVGFAHRAAPGILDDFVTS